MNSRFSLAVHLLCLLATMPGQRVTSEYLATSTGTNPVVVRRLLASLRRAALVTARRAGGGGWLLARPASEITLAQVRHAVAAQDPPRMHRNHPHPNCPVGKEVRNILLGIYHQTDLAIDAELAHSTIAAVLASVLQPAVQPG